MLTFSYDRDKMLTSPLSKNTFMGTSVSVTRIILEKMKELGIITLDSFFPKKYIRTRPARKLFGLDTSPAISPRTLASILSRLKREGIIARVREKGKSAWRLTPKGQNRIKILYQPLIRIPQKDGIERIVIFDIPEQERRKRDKIRAELISYDFRRLQKSVWTGESPLPSEFISLLDDLQLKNKVHIFTIAKRGTLTD